MDDLDKVIKGLECCEGANEHTHCAICPYYKECSDWVLAGGKPAPLIRDALAILKALAASRQARVIKKEELGKLPSGSVVWHETDDLDAGDELAVIPVCYESVKEIKFGGKPEMVILYADGFDLLREYGNGYRLWTARPTEEQRREEKWEDQMT